MKRSPTTGTGAIRVSDAAQVNPRAVALNDKFTRRIFNVQEHFSVYASLPICRKTCTARCTSDERAYDLAKELARDTNGPSFLLDETEGQVYQIFPHPKDISRAEAKQ